MQLPLPPEVEKHLHDGKKIAAIKALREYGEGMGLKDAKEAVEAHIESHASRYPELQRKVISGNQVVLFVVVIGSLAYFLLRSS